MLQLHASLSAVNYYTVSSSQVGRKATAVQTSDCQILIGRRMEPVGVPSVYRRKFRVVSL